MVAVADRSRLSTAWGDYDPYLLAGAPLLTETRDWVAALTAAGTGASLKTTIAVNRLIRGLKAARLWDKIYVLDCCCGNDLTAALVRVKVSGGINRAMTNFNFVSGDYTEATGLTGNGTTKYLDTLFDATGQGMTLTSAGLWCYTRSATVSAGTSRVSLGATPVGANFLLGWLDTGTKESSAIFGTSAGDSPAGSAVGISGFLGGCTNGSRAVTFYRNGVQVGGTDDAAGILSTTTVFKHANRGGAGTPTVWSNRPLSTSLFTQGLNATEVLNLYTLVNAFEIVKGSNV